MLIQYQKRERRTGHPKNRCLQENATVVARLEPSKKNAGRGTVLLSNLQRAQSEDGIFFSSSHICYFLG